MQWRRNVLQRVTSMMQRAEAVPYADRVRVRVRVCSCGCGCGSARVYANERDGRKAGAEENPAVREVLCRR